jgi:hypothetical protein
MLCECLSVQPQERLPPLPFYSQSAGVTRGVYAYQLGWSSPNKLWLQYKLQFLGTKSKALECYYNCAQHGIIMTIGDFSATITVLGQLRSICLVTLTP